MGHVKEQGDRGMGGDEWMRTRMELEAGLGWRRKRFQFSLLSLVLLPIPFALYFACVRWFGAEAMFIATMGIVYWGVVVLMLAAAVEEKLPQWAREAGRTTGRCVRGLKRLGSRV